MELTIKEIIKGDVIKIGNYNIKVLDITLEGSYKVLINNDEEKGFNSMSDFFDFLVNLEKLEYLEQKQSIFTQNCQERIVCGQLGSIASRMALDDNSATTIDGTRKGAGMVKAQGELTNIQYYFEEAKWIEEYYRKRGLDPKGYELNKSENELTEDNFDLGEDEDITLSHDKTVIEFTDIRKEVDNTKNQKFKEV